MQSRGLKMNNNLKVKKKDFELNPFLWRLVEVDGYPIAALYFNGREFSLSQDAMEELSEMIVEYVEAAHRPRHVRTDEQPDSGCGHNHT